MHHLKVQRQQAATAIRSRRMVAAWSSRTAGWLGRRQRTAGCASWPRSTARRVIVTGSASPDDPELALYWADHRGRKHNGPLSVLMLGQAQSPDGTLLTLQDARFCMPVASHSTCAIGSSGSVVSGRRPASSTSPTDRAGRSALIPTACAARAPRRRNASIDPCVFCANRTCLSRMNGTVRPR